MNLGIFLPNWIGDVTMATPAIRALRTFYPRPSRLIAVARPYVRDVLGGSDWFDEQVLYDPRSAHAELRSRAVARRLRRLQLDAVMLMPNSLRAAVVAWLAQAPIRVGYVRYCRGPLLTHKLYHPRLKRGWLPTPGIDSYLQLAYALGCPTEAPRMELATTVADERAADDAWSMLRLPPGRAVVTINAGGAYGAAKRWPAEYVAALARRIAVEQGMGALVCCGPSEYETAQQIVALADHPAVVSLAGQPMTLGLTKACIRRSRLLVSTDSGPRFFAPALGVPLVSLLGPTDERNSHMHDVRETRLQITVPCGPCGRRACPLVHHRCMRELTVEMVYHAVCRELGADGQARAA